jgi:hypothetical protein
VTQQHGPELKSSQIKSSRLGDAQTQFGAQLKSIQLKSSRFKPSQVKSSHLGDARHADIEEMQLDARDGKRCRRAVLPSAHRVWGGQRAAAPAHKRSGAICSDEHSGATMHVHATLHEAVTRG